MKRAKAIACLVGFLASPLLAADKNIGPWIVHSVDHAAVVQKLREVNPSKPESLNAKIDALLEELRKPEFDPRKGERFFPNGDGRLFIGAGTAFSVFMIHYDQKPPKASKKDPTQGTDEEYGEETESVEKSEARCLPQVRVVEVPRRERGDKDLVTLLQLMPYIGGAGRFGASVEALKPCEWDTTKYRLTGLKYVTQEDRADIRFRAGFDLRASDGDEEVTGRTPSLSSDYYVIADLRDIQTKGSGEVSARIATGARESFFVSADAIVSDTKVLKYDRAAEELQLEKPPQFLIGLNFSFGDMVGNPRRMADRLFAKVMLTASDQPTSNFGIGIGFRGSGLGGEIVDLSPLMFFGGYMWTEEDEVSPEGTVNEAGHRVGDWQFGIGFDLSKAFEWLKP